MTAYLSAWLSVIKGDPKRVIQAASHAQRAANLIRGITPGAAAQGENDNNNEEKRGGGLTGITFEKLDLSKLSCKKHIITHHQRNLIENFRRRLDEAPTFSNADIILFGSILGRSFPFSDIDVAVISDEFSNIRWNERIKKLRAFCPPHSMLSPIGVTENELSAANYPTVIRSIREAEPQSRKFLEKWKFKR